MRNGEDWDACEKLMKKGGFTVPENFEDYKYTRCNVMLVAKHGDTYWDALTKSVYNPIGIEYAFEASNQSEDGSRINITLGMQDEAYWSAYFGFENVDGVWMHVESEEAVEYENMTIYGMNCSSDVCVNKHLLKMETADFEQKRMAV